MDRNYSLLPPVAVADQISAAIQPSTVQPKSRFTSKIASDWWCFRYFAKANGRKYRPRAAQMTIRPHRASNMGSERTT